MFVIFNIAEIGAVRSVVPKRQLQHAFAAEQARLAGRRTRGVACETLRRLARIYNLSGVVDSLSRMTIHP